MKQIFLFFALLIISILQLILTAETDLYKIMGVKRNASQNEIKKKYRELSKKYHPDRNKGDAAATQLYTDLGEAYEILSDAKKRRKYDRGGMAAVKEEDHEHNPFDIFGMFGGGGRKGQRKDEDLRVNLRASLKDLYIGKEFEVKY